MGENIKTCLYCKHEFKKNPKFSRKQFLVSRFCSNRCAAKHNRILNPQSPTKGKTWKRSTPVTPQERINRSIPQIGKMLSEETKQKIREARKKQIMTPETCRKISESNKGKVHSLEARIKISKAHKGKPVLKNRGENCHFWKGGITPINSKIRQSLEMRIWRESVFKRDNWCCSWCGLKGGWNKLLKRRIILHADHIKQFAHFPELRFAIDNGRALCKECHSIRHSNILT